MSTPKPTSRSSRRRRHSRRRNPHGRPDCPAGPPPDPATAGRNLALVWDNLAICIAHHIPASRAQGLLTELATTVQFNVQVQQEVHARTSGQRLQIWLLAAIVPGLFLYLRLVDRDFFAVLDETLTGRLLLFPAAVCLEVLGVVLSFRVSRVEP